MTDYITTHPWSWSGNGNDWMEYPRGINEDGRKLENHLYLLPNGEWTNTYELPKGSQILNPGERPQDLKPRKRISAWDEQLDYTQEPEPTYEKDQSYEHGPIKPALEEQYATWGNPEAGRIGKIRECDIGLPTAQRGKWELKEAAWEKAILATRNARPSEALSLDCTREDDGNTWGPITGDPLDALMEEEQDEIREESRQYQLSLLLRLMSDRQRKCMTLTSEGLSDKQIAQRMRIKEGKIREIRRSARRLIGKSHKAA